MRLPKLAWLALPLSLAACAPPEEAIGEADEAMKICATGGTLEGVDVSHWNGTIDWAKVKASGRVFAFVKATEGTGFVDNKFATNWAAMKQEGVLRGAYHFFHSDDDAIAEADHFLSTIGTLEPGDLPPVLDLEVSDGQSASVITSHAIAWLDHVANATGMRPILYTGPNFVNNTLKNPAGLETHADIWVANWGVTCPDVPLPFTAWPFWQYDDAGTVPGIAGGVDVNRFNGSLAQLQALTVPDPSSSSSSSSSGSSSGGTGTGGAGMGGGTTTTTSTTTKTPSATSTLTGGAGGEGGSGTETEESKSGCSCSTPSSSESAYQGLGLLGLVGMMALRKRKNA